MRPLSESTARVTGKSFNRKYVALGRIVRHWKEIVGVKLSSKAQPVRIRYRKHEKAKKLEASLDIAVSSADATVLHYQKDLILERINQIFGEKWIKSIRFVHMASNAQAPFRKKTDPVLSGTEQNTLSGMLTNVVDEEIKSRLNRLGAAVLSVKE